MADYTIQLIMMDGVILQVMKYCDTHEYEVPALKEYFENLDMPVFHLEHEYTTLALAALKTRIEAFLEMIGLPEILMPIHGERKSIFEDFSD